MNRNQDLFFFKINSAHFAPTALHVALVFPEIIFGKIEASATLNDLIPMTQTVSYTHLRAHET